MRLKSTIDPAATPSPANVDAAGEIPGTYSRSDIGNGAKWMVLLRMFDRVLAVANNLVLARLLTPVDFGIVAMAASVIALVELVTAFGFDVVLIQNPAPDRRHYNTAWTLSIALYCSCAGLIGLFSIPAAAFYREPRLITAMLVIGMGWILRGFENPAVVNFRRRMDFAREFLYTATIRVSGVILTIIAAIVFRSYWALVVGMVASRVIGLGLSYAMVPYRPRFDLSAAREMLAFSRWLLANNAALVGVVRLPHFLIGRLLGPQPLGLFTMSYDLATLPSSELSAPVNRAALPGYSRMAGDKPRFKTTFLDIGSAVMALALPASAGVMALAKPLVLVLLGEKWLGAVPIIQVLSISAAFVAASGNNGVAHLAAGSPKWVTFQSLVRLVVLAVLGLSLGPMFGIMGVTVAELCGGVAVFIASFPVIFRHLEITWIEYCARVWRPFVATFGMAAIVHVVQGYLPGSVNLASSMVVLAVAVPAGVAAYVALLAALWWLSGRPEGTETMLAGEALGMIRRRRV